MDFFCWALSHNFFAMVLTPHHTSPPTTPMTIEIGSTARPVERPMSAMEFPTPAPPTRPPIRACSVAPHSVSFCCLFIYLFLCFLDESRFHCPTEMVRTCVPDTPLSVKVSAALPGGADGTVTLNW